ncbi:oxidoreductase domain-containing protein [Xylariaceae sp. FL0662B]|nr:oxidoreductase domain-containing protein [Xylariaceae sp. FL0662B]
MAALYSFVRRNWQIAKPPNTGVPKSAAPLRFGILGAADIAPRALITPAKSHPEVVVQVVAARDPKKAKAYAEKHGIPEVATTYQDILDNPAIDCVYIPLPNGLHYEWALRALKAGKHVLLEKPAANNGMEAKRLFESPPLLTAPSPPVLLEATHYVFHPAWTAFLRYVTPSAVARARAVLWVPRWEFADDDIRFRYELGGGALLDLGVYTASALTRIFGAAPEACESCDARPGPYDERCERLYSARYRFPGGGRGEMAGDLRAPLTRLAPVVDVEHRPVVVSGADAGGVEVPEGREVVRTRRVKFTTYIQPAFFHSIQVDDEFVLRTVGDSSPAVVRSWRKSKTVKAYTFKEAGVEQPGEPHWLTYRYQLEQFVNKVRGREAQQWVTGADSINTLQMIDMAYEAAKLPLRPTSEYS